MKTLIEIQDEVAGGVGLESWKFAYRHDEITSGMIDEVAKRYAQSVAEDLRERIAEEAKMTITNIKGEILTESQAEWDDFDGYRCRVSKQSILNLPIELK